MVLLLVASSLDLQYYEDKTKGLLDEILNKGSVYQSFTLLSFTDISVNWPKIIYQTNNSYTDKDKDKDRARERYSHHILILCTSIYIHVRM